MLASHPRTRRRGALLFVALALAVAAGAVYLFTRADEEPPAPPREMDEIETNLRASLGRDPCDPRLNLNLVDHLLLQHLDEVALADGYRALGRCGRDVAPLWRMLALHQKRNEWTGATFISTILVDRAPRDSDFWWWRGEAIANAGHPWPALADYRQSLANSDGAQAGGFAVVRFGDPAAAVGDRCEGARAWRFYTDVLGGDMTQDARDGYASLVRAGTCTPEDGTGSARIAIDAMSGTGRVATTVGAATGTFEFDSAAGTTVVSRAFAARAGLVARSGERGTTFHGGALVSGQPAVAPSIAAGGATAANVDVLISDDLAPDEDGVLGVSFLWHFAVANDGDTVTLSPPPADAPRRADAPASGERQARRRGGS
jgi:hypothetical protein